MQYFLESYKRIVTASEIISKRLQVFTQDYKTNYLCIAKHCYRAKCSIAELFKDVCLQQHTSQQPMAASHYGKILYTRVLYILHKRSYQA